MVRSASYRAPSLRRSGYSATCAALERHGAKMKEEP
jgi:hypothetical protein